MEALMDNWNPIDQINQGISIYAADDLSAFYYAYHPGAQEASVLKITPKSRENMLRCLVKFGRLRLEEEMQMPVEQERLLAVSVNQKRNSALS